METEGVTPDAAGTCKDSSAAATWYLCTKAQQISLHLATVPVAYGSLHRLTWGGTVARCTITPLGMVNIVIYLCWMGLPCKPHA